MTVARKQLTSIEPEAPGLPAVHGGAKEDAAALTTAIVVSGATLSMAIWLVQWMFGRLADGFERRLSALEEDHVPKADLKDLVELLREEHKSADLLRDRLAALNTSLSADYVRREDWIRLTTVFEAKLDAIMHQLHQAILKIASDRQNDTKI